MASKAATFRILGISPSTCTQRTLFTAYERGATVELVPVNLMAGEQKKPEHMAKQPFGKIPVLEQPGFVLYESRAIARYINDSSTTGTSLVPTDPKQRAIFEQWASLEAGTYNPHLEGLVAQRVFVPMRGGTTDEAKCKEHYDALKEPLDILNNNLANKEYIAGSFTLVDIFFTPYVRMLMNLPEKDLIESRPNVAAWWKRLSGRPAFQKLYKQVDEDRAAMMKKK